MRPQYYTFIGMICILFIVYQQMFQYHVPFSELVITVIWISTMTKLFENKIVKHLFYLNMTMIRHDP